MKKKASNIPKIRKSWVINPRMRIKDSAKKDKRAKGKKELRKAIKEVDKDEKDSKDRAS